MRIGAFATFVLLTMTSIIEWSPCWYAFAALLSPRLSAAFIEQAMSGRGTDYQL